MIGVGPSPNGEFHPEAVQQMKGAGTWLKVNGEAIYATRPLEDLSSSEDDTVRYTRSKDQRFVYAILTNWPGTRVTLKSVRPKPNSKITFLGSNASMPWSLASDRGVTVTLPENLQQASNRVCKYAWSLKIETF